MLGSNSGLILGRMVAPRPTLRPSPTCSIRASEAVACERFLALFRKSSEEQPLARLTKAVHTAVFAPTGVGKGVSIVIPQLLTCPDSMVVVDFKGENYKITAKHREKTFGHTIVALDPFKVVCQTPDTFNPLDSITADNPLALDDCRDLAEALVVRPGRKRSRTGRTRPSCGSPPWSPSSCSMGKPMTDRSRRSGNCSPTLKKWQRSSS